MEKFACFWVNQNYLKEIPRIFEGKFLVFTLREENTTIVKGQCVPLYLPKPRLPIKSVKAALPGGHCVFWRFFVRAEGPRLPYGESVCVCARIQACAHLRVRLLWRGRCTHVCWSCSPGDTHSCTRTARAAWVPWRRAGVCARFVQHGLCFTEERGARVGLGDHQPCYEVSCSATFVSLAATPFFCLY